MFFFPLFPEEGDAKNQINKVYLLKKEKLNKNLNYIRGWRAKHGVRTKMIQCVASTSSLHAPHFPSLRLTILPGTPSNRIYATASFSPELSRRRAISLSAITTAFSLLVYSNNNSSICWSKSAITDFTELDNSGGVKALDLRIGDGDLPLNGDQVSTPLYI